MKFIADKNRNNDNVYFEKRILFAGMGFDDTSLIEWLWGPTGVQRCVNNLKFIPAIKRFK